MAGTVTPATRSLLGMPSELRADEEIAVVFWCHEH